MDPRDWARTEFREPDFPGTHRFQLVRRLGEGGMGVVYEVLDREHGVRMALKTLRTWSADAFMRFKHEFRALQDIHHPNLIRLGELLEEGGRWFFTMELVEGPSFLAWVRGEAGSGVFPSLTRRSQDTEQDTPLIPDIPLEPARSFAPPPEALAARPPFDEQRLRAAFAQLAQGLHALHQGRKIHRDIKPSNVRVTREGRVVVLDFGLIYDWSEDVLGPQRRRVGSPSHMAPEQASLGKVGPASDWYSVGVLLYQALTGTLPFTGDAEEMLWRKQHAVPPPPGSLVPGVPEDLAQLTMELLRIDPEARPTGAELLARLHAQAPPALLGYSMAPEFLGRARELGVLRSAFAEVQRGRTVTLLVHGASGVGKSVLVRRFLEQLSVLEEALVFSGRCYERESVPYKAVDGVIDAISRHLTLAGPETAAAVLPRDQALLGIMFPVMRRVALVDQAARPAIGEIDPRVMRKRVFSVLRELLVQLGLRRPVVLAIDDLQWTDVDSLALLAELLRPPKAPPLLLLATMRTAAAEHEERQAPVMPSGLGVQSFCSVQTVAMTLPGEVRRLEVGGLPPVDAEELVMRLARRSGVSEEIARAIADEADGHPLFIDELVRYRHEVHGGEGEAPAGSLPLGAALWARIERLAEPTRRLLELLAVAGTPLRHDTTAEAAGVTLAQLGELLAPLRSGNLVKTTGARKRDTVEPYHDRVREAVLAHLPMVARREWHQRLAVALEASRRADAEALAIHWRGQGDLEKAASYAAQAANEAYAALAFDRAARLFRMALTLGRRPPAERQGLLAQLGDALANAGRGGEAAEAYLSAVEGATPEMALDLRRRAAEQLLRSGRIDEGLEVLRIVLQAVGLELPTTPRRALALLLMKRAQVRLRGLSFRERNASEIPREELTRIDVCWSVAAALGLVDPLRGRYFDASGLIYALDAGEPHRIARALAVEASYAAVEGGAGHERTARLVREATRLAERLGHPYGLAWATAAAGITAALEGRWREAQARCEEAEYVFRERCTGVAWERATAHWFALWSLAYLGRIGELVQAVPEWLREAIERGDLYTRIAHTTGLPNLVWLARGNPEEAHKQAEEAMRRWSPQHFQVEHWWELLAQVQIRLYQGDGGAALRLVEERWDGLDRSLLLRVQLTRLEAWQLRARAALGAAEERRGFGQTALWHEAERDAERITREGMPWSSPLALLIRAAVTTRQGGPERALGLLRQAVTGCEAADMALYAAAARYRLGQLLGGDEGQRLVAEATTWMRGQSIVDPPRMVAMLAPGFGV